MERLWPDGGGLVSVQPKRRDPTHTLRIDIPLNLTANPAAETWDIEGAMREAMTMVHGVARVGTLGLLCDQIVVTLEDLSRLVQGEEE